MKEIKCLRCNKDMEFQGREKIQLGEAGLFLGRLSNVASGALSVRIYICQFCGKVEFFHS